MSILIKGTEMPESCFNCKFPRACQAIIRRIDEMDRTEWFPQDHRHSDCPLIEVPEPHGRLIDADALLKKCEFVCTDDDVNVRAVRYSVVDAAQTVIPASPASEEG